MILLPGYFQLTCLSSIFFSLFQSELRVFYNFETSSFVSIFMIGFLLACTLLSLEEDP